MKTCLILKAQGVAALPSDCCTHVWLPGPPRDGVAFEELFLYKTQNRQTKVLYEIDCDTLRVRGVKDVIKMMTEYAADGLVLTNMDTSNVKSLGVIIKTCCMLPYPYNRKWNFFLGGKSGASVLQCFRELTQIGVGMYVDGVLAEEPELEVLQTMKDRLVVTNAQNLNLLRDTRGIMSDDIQSLSKLMSVDDIDGSKNLLDYPTSLSVQKLVRTQPRKHVVLQVPPT